MRYSTYTDEITIVEQGIEEVRKVLMGEDCGKNVVSSFVLLGIWIRIMVINFHIRMISVLKVCKREDLIGSGEEYL